MKKKNKVCVQCLAKFDAFFQGDLDDVRCQECIDKDNAKEAHQAIRRRREETMAKITGNGVELYRKLNHEVDINALDMMEITSLIARHAKTHHRLMELGCSGEYNNPYWKWSEKWQNDLEKRIQLNERRIVELAQQIDCEVEFSGDPRGATVYLKNGIESDYDDWGGRGVCAIV